MMKKLLIVLLLFGSVSVFAQDADTPTDVKRIYDKIEDYRTSLDAIITSGDSPDIIKKDVAYFSHKMNTLNNYLNSTKKRYANKPYNTADLEAKVASFEAYYESQLANYSSVEEKLPTDIQRFYDRMDENKADLQKLVSGTYEAHVVDRMLGSFEKSQLPKINNGLKGLKERYKDTNYEFDIQSSYDSMIVKFQNIKNGISSGEINVEESMSQVKEMRIVRNQLMMFSSKWDYRAEHTQPNDLQAFVSNLILAFDWQKMPSLISELTSTDMTAKDAQKYLNNLIDVIKNEDDFLNTMLGFMTDAVKVRFNDGYPNQEYTKRANNIVANVEQSIEFAEVICGSLAKLSVVEQNINEYKTQQTKKVQSSDQLSSLPTAGMTDTKLESDLVTYFNTLGWQEVFYKTIITSYEWDHRRSPGGEIVSRTLGVAMASRKTDGSCIYQNFTIIQQKTLDGFGRSEKLSVGNQSRISCD